MKRAARRMARAAGAAVTAALAWAARETVLWWKTRAKARTER